MRSRPNPLYGLLDMHYHESFSAYVPQRADFYDLVSSRLPAGWQISRQNIWFYCSSATNTMPSQGWKIHVSATPANAREVLERVMSVLFRSKTANFKFTLDLGTLFLVNSKNWPRAASGKFVTIYPPNNNSFLDLIEELHVATEGLRGPYILSDRRYKDCGVIFYRYGGMQLRRSLNVNGEKTAMLVGPDGVEVPDQRLPYPFTPEWATRVLPAEETDTDATSLRGGRYLIEDVLSFSNAGGVYRARDGETGKQVVIKEARPWINAATDGYDAVELLKKEYRILRQLSELRIAPEPYELFQEWEHWFLVEEYIEGISMASHSAVHNVLLKTRAREHDYREWYQSFRVLCTSLARIMEILSRRNIVFADLSTTNLIVLKGEPGLKIIDFESAYEIGVERPIAIYTPGFASGDRMAGGEACISDDHYAMGAVLLAYLFPVTGLIQLNAGAKYEVMESIQRDARLPREIAAMILDLMDADPVRRPTPGRVLEIVKSTNSVAGPTHATEEVGEDTGVFITQILTHIRKVATYERQDRLFPSDPKVFVTNPLSLAYGAAGVVYALHRVGRQFPQAAVDWILAHEITKEEYPPGFYIGLAGIGLALLEIGVQEEAERIFRMSFDHPLLDAAADIFHGISGWGMTSLRFFLHTADEFYLEQARRAGDQLLQTSRQSAHGLFWSSSNEVNIGFAHGASGIGLFLLYLSLATKDERYLAAGRAGLEFDLAHGRETKDGGLSWPHRAGAESPLYPYWRSGSAGIGGAVLRFYRLLGEERHREILEKIFIDVDRKHAVSPARFMGLAGLGDFLMDMNQFTGESRYLESARKVAKGIRQFRVERNGIAFPGDFLSRLCCDLGTGSAGIALFLNRLAGHPNSDFMLDALLYGERSGLRIEETEKSSLGTG
jgi:hypothetical protein